MRAILQIITHSVTTFKIKRYWKIRREREVKGSWKNFPYSRHEQ